MDFLVLAAGEGSRLKKGGIAASKPMVQLAGQPLIERLTQAFVHAGAGRLLVIYNETSPDVAAWLAGANLPVPLVTVCRSTPSSFHSFAALVPLIQSERFCLTTVDTVFDPAAFRQCIAAFEDSDADGMMGVTAHVDDESPLWVRTGESLQITAFEDDRTEGLRYVSGGIYCLRRSALPTVARCLDKGVHRMRNFQRALLEDGLRLTAYPFEKILDVDRPEDLRAAEDWLRTATL